jgi:hypothetical protein
MYLVHYREFLITVRLFYIPTDRKLRDCCWDIDQRGSVGETVLHLCLLNATAIHADLAKRLIQAFPKMINDIYLADEYFGNTVLFTEDLICNLYYSLKPLWIK